MAALRLTALSAPDGTWVLFVIETPVVQAGMPDPELQGTPGHGRH